MLYRRLPRRDTLKGVKHAPLWGDCDGWRHTEWNQNMGVLGEKGGSNSVSSDTRDKRSKRSSGVATHVESV